MSQYAMDADFIVENLQRSGKLRSFGAETSSNIDNNAGKAGGGSSSGLIARVTGAVGKIMPIATRNYVILILVVLLFIIMMGFISVTGILADIVVGFLALCLIFAIGSKVYMMRQGDSLTPRQ